MVLERMWVRNVRVGKVIPPERRKRRGQVTKGVDVHTLDAHKIYAIKHINYEGIMVSTGIVDIFDVDKKVDIMPAVDPTEKERQLSGRCCTS